MPSALPSDHALRLELNDEVHARPTPAVRSPVKVSYVALLSSAAERAREWNHFAGLLSRLDHRLPATPLSFYVASFDAFTIRYERHTEFSRYTITAPGVSEDYFATTALMELPEDWLRTLPGETFLAIHGVVVAGLANGIDPQAISERYFNGNALIGSLVGENAAAAFTDFRVQQDGFSRFVLADFQMTPRQTGRTVQRILEIDTYRMLALLALPVARRLGPLLTEYEQELSGVTRVLETADVQDEAILLDRLTHLEAQIASDQAESRYRFTAADAYYELVQRRIGELREARLHGLQPFGEFTERRLAPAMNTCKAASARQELVSQHVARANELLATRVDLTRQHQNQDLLESMNKRAKAQFELQKTVEGLSVAAITYDVVGLIGYAAKGLHAIGWRVNYEILMGGAIPITAGVLLLGTRYLHRANSKKSGLH